jgi:hypothetical protein
LLTRCRTVTVTECGCTSTSALSTYAGVASSTAAPVASTGVVSDLQPSHASWRIVGLILRKGYCSNCHRQPHYLRHWRSFS